MNASNHVATTGLIVEHRTARGPVRALEQAPFEVVGGTSLAIMGPSGCGKSTLLGLLAGLAVPTDGSVSIGDTVLSALPERQRIRFRRQHLGMVYQADNLLPFLTVEENVALPGAIAGVSRSETDRDLLERLGVADLARRLPDQLSGGQRQRVAVARAVAHRPAVVLADEPTGALDERNARRVIELLIETHRSIGATLIVVTHDNVIAAHADRTMVIGADPCDEGASACRRTTSLQT